MGFNFSNWLGTSMASKVLVVDDSKTARKEVVRVVHNHGILTVEAKNGKEALAKLQDKDDISLVFCDVNMPEMNGIEFLEAVKKIRASWRNSDCDAYKRSNPRHHETSEGIGCHGLDHQTS